jgi:hypothetical protein
MAKMLIDAAHKPESTRFDFPPIETDRLIAMMMVMSDCGDWLTNHPSQANDANHTTDVALWRVFEGVGDDLFLTKVLPCWSPSLSPISTQMLSTRLVKIIEELASLCRNGPINQRASYKERLDYALDWCCHFAWNGTEQVTMSTYSSLYTSYFMSLVFRNPCQMVLEENQSHAHVLVKEAANRNCRTVTSPSPSGLTFNRMQIDELAATASSSSSPTSRPMRAANVLAHSSASGPVYLDASRLACFSSSDDDEEEYTEEVYQAGSLSNRKEECDTRPHDDHHTAPSQITENDPFASSIAPSSPTSSTTHQSLVSLYNRYTFMPDDDPYKLDEGYQRRFAQPDAFHALVFGRLATFNIHNVREDSIVPRTHKLALRPVDIIHFVKHHQDSSHSRLYVPMTSRNGAPDGDSDCYFVLPPRNRRQLPFLQYHTPTPPVPVHGAPPLAITSVEGRHGSVRSVHAAEARRMISDASDLCALKFVPTTVAASNLPLCAVKERVIGTTGAMEVKLVDSGETNDLVVGITWSLREEEEEGIGNSPGGRRHLEDIVPGFTPTSIGLCPNGVLYYIDADGRPVSSTYTAPFASGSKIVICVAYDRVYFIVDSVFYPPVPGLVLPKSAQVHGLFRFGCLGIKISMRHMSSTWNQNRNHDGSLVHAVTNPVAHAIYLAELRTKVCPHYHAQRLRLELQPNLDHIFPLSEGVGGSLETDWTPVLGSGMIEKIALVQMGREECQSEHCRAPAVVRAKIARISNSPVITDAAPSSADRTAATTVPPPAPGEGMRRRTLSDY